MKKYTVHYGVVLGYDIEVLADNEDEAIRIADEKFEEVNYDEMEFGSVSSEAVDVAD